MASVLVLYVLLAPIVFGALDAVTHKRWYSMVGSLSSLLAIADLWLIRGPVVVSLPFIPLSYGSQTIGLLLASVTTLVWFAISIFSQQYLRHEHHSSRFVLLFGLSVAGAMACFLARDFLGLFLGFELMSLASHGLVAHDPTPAAQKAAHLYHQLGNVSGIVLVVALTVLGFQVGSLSYDQLSNMPLWVALLLSLGFAIKVGAFPIHFWLPKAHPVAPSPGSALLSGILIKTGAYGLLLVASLTAAPQTYGLIMLVIALITMTWGVIMALLQHDAKRMLAYHSVSQMGYILLGIGLWAFERNALGFGGAIFHMINHAIFKSALFLICGSALLAAKTTDIYNLGSMRKAFGIATPLMLLPALGIAGIPGFNGYISKTLLHSALASSHLSHTLHSIADLMFILVAFGTVCSFTKFTWFVFFADRKDQRTPEQRASKAEIISIGLLSVATLALGMYPQPVLSTLATAVAQMGGSWPAHLHLFDGHALQSAWMVLGGGLLLYCICYYTGVFHLHPPQITWESVLKLVHHRSEPKKAKQP